MRSGVLQIFKFSNFANSITFDYEIVRLLVFAEKDNEFSAPTSKIFQDENVLQIRLNLALIDLSASKSQFARESIIQKV